MTILLSVLITQLVRSMQRQNSEEYAHVLIENLNHQVFVQFFIPMGILFDGDIQLSNQKQFDRMDNVVRSTLHSFKVEALNIYSMDNTISYSLNQNLLGRKNYGGTGYQQALEGKITSRLIQRG